MNRGLDAITLGLVPISKFVFSREDARRYKKLTEERLRRLGVRFVNIDAVTEDGMLFRRPDLPQVVAHLRAAEVDALFCPHCNFGTEDVAALLGREMRLPYLLWGPRDEAPLADGTRLRDTQCGLFATSRILRRLNVPFTYIPNCRLEDPVFDRGVLAFLQVASACKAFRRLRIGQIGQRNDFFWTVMINEARLLEQFGIEVLPIYLSDVVDRMAALVESPGADLLDLVRAMQAQVTFESLGESQVRAIAALKLVLAELVAAEGLSALALQCFPVLQQRFGIYPCYANSLVTAEGSPVICEMDIHGAVTACLLQAATLHESPPFFADLTIRHPQNDNAELLWHCGAFPIALADEGVAPKVGDHFIMPGPEAGVGHWRVRGGDVTIARFEDDGDEYRLAFGEARGATGPETVGTYLWIEVNDWLAWERKFIRGPYIHHVAAVHGRLAPILQEACRYFPGLSPDPVDQSPQALEDFWWYG
jgi:L-fucose isomerase-like protein